MRPAPAFQEYASDMLVNTSGMTLSERGLLTSMRWRCWTHQKIPRAPELLAPLIGVPSDQIEESLTAAVMVFFQTSKEQQDMVYCPELEDYRVEMTAKRQSSRKNGAKGGRSTGERLSKALQRDASAHSEINREKSKKDEMSRIGLSRRKSQDHTEWLTDYEQSEARYPFLPEN